MAFLRLLGLLLIGLSLIYLSLFFYLRAARRERLMRDAPSDATERDRSAFVEDALRAYVDRMKYRLMLAVYAVPLAGLVSYIYVTNFL